MSITRRQFLGTVSAAALAPSPVLAWPVHGGGAATGRSVLNGFDLSDYPFKNFMKSLNSIQATGGTYAFPANLDANQYPTVGTLTNDYFGALPWPGAVYSGTWRLRWTGKCKLNLSPFQTPNTGFTVVADPSGAVSGSTAFTMTVVGTTSSYIDFTLNGVCTSMTVTFKANGDFTGFSNLILCRRSSPYANDEASILSGVPENQFNDDFLNNVVQLNPLILRALDAQPINNTNVSRYAYFAQSDNLTYAGYRWLPNIWAGDTSGTNTYTCAAPSDLTAWVDGATFQVRFTQANTVTTPTIQPTGLTQKTLVLPGNGTIPTSGQGSISANYLATCVYDATLDKVQVFVANPTDVVGFGLSTGWPLSIYTALANKLNKHLWVLYPHLIDDAGVTSIATYVRNNLRTNLTAYHELSNEVWNSKFYQTALYRARGTALGFTVTPLSIREYSYYGFRFRQIMDLVKTAWSTRSSSYKRVMSFQFFGDTTNTNSYRFQGSDLGSYGYNTFPNRPIDYADCLSYAPYYSGANLRGPSDLNYTGSPALTAGNLAALTAAADAVDINWVDTDVRAGTTGVANALGTNTLTYFKNNLYGPWQTIAASYPLPIVCYEGGFEGNAPSTGTCTSLGISTSYGGSTGKIAVLLAAYKNSLLFKQLVLDQWADFMGGSNVNSLYPAWYTYGRAQWAIYPTGTYSTPYKSAAAMTQYNQ